jgi:hypothetical protein
MAKTPPKRAERHPAWQPEIVFRSKSEKMAMFVHGTGRTVFTAAGVRHISDTRLQFRGGKYIAKGKKLYRILDPVTDEETVVDEVSYMLSHPLYAPNGGVKGVSYWIERGFEDAMDKLDDMKRIIAKDPDAIPNEQLITLGAAIAKVRGDLERQKKPSSVPVVHGVRDSRLEVKPEPGLHSLDMLAEGLVKADPALETDVRQLITSGPSEG